MKLDLKIDVIVLGSKSQIPISVIVPLGESDIRKTFFYDYTLPTIKANNPSEIIVVSGVGSATEKRNLGFEKSSMPFIFFCDDDILLPSSHLINLGVRLEKSMEHDSSVGYCYTGYLGIVLDKRCHPMGGNFHIAAVEFNEDSLRSANYISTMSLIKRECFTEFDNELERFQDWDLWLTLLNKRIKGVLYGESKFMAFYLDEGITSNSNDPEKSHQYILKKHSKCLK